MSFKVSELKYLVVGTGRSGTVYMARLLSSLGIPCGHESIFSYDGISKAITRLQDGAECSFISSDVKWLKPDAILNAECSYMAAPYLDHEILKNTKIIHAVRNPMKVITSFVDGFNYFKKNEGDYQKFIYKIFPELLDISNPYNRAAKYYILWNKMIEKRNNFFFNVESSPYKLMKYLGVEKDDYYRERNANHHRDLAYRDYEIIKDEKIRANLLELARKYGYLVKLI